MTRKKIPTGVNNTAAVLDLDEGEQLVKETTTTERIGKERREPPASKDTVTVEPIEDDDEAAEEEEPRPFSDTSLAAALFDQDDEQSLADQRCTVIVRRNADAMNDRFRTPCNTTTHLPKLRNIELLTDKSDIEELVQREYGGGHYFFQIQINGRLGPTWSATLLDLPTPPAAYEPTPTPAVVPPVPPPPPVDPMTNFLDNLEKQKRMEKLLFGDREEQFKSAIADLKAEIAASQAAPAEPKSERLQLLDSAMSADGDIQKKILDHLFAPDEQRHWIADVIEIGLNNQDKIMALVGTVFGMLGRPTAPPAYAPMPAIPAQPFPPAAAPTQSLFVPRSEQQPLPADADAETATPETEDKPE